MVEQKMQRTVSGTVVSDKMIDSIVVLVERRVQHPLYKKVIKKSTKIHAHDPKNECNIGDLVRIQETKPISKMKAWKLLEIVKRAD